MTERAIDQYDPMGRVLSERQCFLGGCAAAAYTLTHSYDLAGNVVGSNNGIAGANAAAFVYAYDILNKAARSKIDGRITALRAMQ
ncbi:MAG: hypothetical protein ACYCPO_15360 [Acidobacteriaceae bacterium]